MKKTAACLLIALPVASGLHAGVVASYTDCQASVKNGVLHLEPLPERRPFTEILDQIRIEPGGIASEILGLTGRETFIVSGRIVSDNSGMPVQGVAVSIRAPGGGGYLAALSNTDGEVRFSVRIEDVAPRPGSWDPSYSELYLPSISEGDLLLGGEFARNRTLVGGTVSRYRLADLTVASRPAVRQD